MWKGLAVADASMAGVFAANLARKGLTGPNEIFEGKHGFFSQITGKSNLDIGKFSEHGKNFKIAEVHIKKYPAEYNSLSAIEAALELRKKININEIKKINIKTFTPAYEIIADKEKWYPANRETADHSLPYIVCVALVDGTITEDQFSLKRISDPKLKNLVQKVDVKPSKECDKDYYPGTPTIVEVVTKSGEKYSSKVVHPRGSYKNPMTDEELEGKFKELTGKYLTQKQIDNVLKVVWKLEKEKSISGIISRLYVNK